MCKEGQEFAKLKAHSIAKFLCGFNEICADLSEKAINEIIDLIGPKVNPEFLCKSFNFCNDKAVILSPQIECEFCKLYGKSAE